MTPSAASNSSDRGACSRRYTSDQPHSLVKQECVHPVRPTTSPKLSMARITVCHPFIGYPFDVPQERLPSLKEPLTLKTMDARGMARGLQADIRPRYSRTSGRDP